MSFLGVHILAHMPRFSTEHESDHTFLNTLEEDFWDIDELHVDSSMFPSLEHEEDTNDSTDEYGELDDDLPYEAVDSQTFPDTPFDYPVWPSATELSQRLEEDDTELNWDLPEEDSSVVYSAVEVGELVVSYSVGD